jgi:hypothetical protein
MKTTAPRTAETPTHGRGAWYGGAYHYAQDGRGDWFGGTGHMFCGVGDDDVGTGGGECGWRSATLWSPLRCEPARARLRIPAAAWQGRATGPSPPA